MKVNALLYSGLYRMPKGRKRRVPDVAEDEEEAETETCRAPGNEDREDEADADREKEHEKENTSLVGKSIRASTRASRMTTAVVEDDASEDEKLEEEEDKTSRRGKGARPQSRHLSSRKRQPPMKASQDGNYYCQTPVETLFSFTQTEDGPVINQREAQASQCEMRPQDEKQFQGLSQDQQKVVVSEAIRYIFFKAARREPVHRQKLHDEVVKKYGKALVRPVLKAAAEQLESIFGYTLVTPPAYRFPRDADQESYYLITSIRSHSLSKAMNAYGKDVAYRGFCMLVMGLVFCAQNKIPEQVLFKQLQEAQDGLELVSKSQAGGGGAEGGYAIHGALDGVGDAATALERMRKEQYLIRDREQVEVSGGSMRDEFSYRLGQRAYVEVGPRQILTFLAEAQGQDVDPTMLMEIETEEQRGARGERG